jgi:carboxyl-terminal processing protease
MKSILRGTDSALARCAVSIVVTLAAIGAAAAADLSLASRRADFEQLVKAVEEDDVYLSAGGHCWGEVRSRLAAHVDAASTDDAWRRVLEDAIDELHDFHAGVSPDSAATRWAVPTSADIWAEWRGAQAFVTAVRAGSDAERAGVQAGDEVVRIDGARVVDATQAELHCDAARADATARRWALLTQLAGRKGAARELVLRDGAGALRTVSLPARRRFDRPKEAVTAQRLSPETALIRLNNSIGRNDTVAAFDAALASVRDAPALILDLRDLPSGGNSTVALGILGRFVSQRMPYQRHRVPAYGLPDVERNWVEEVAPRGPFTYTGKLVVLVDAWTGSMGEGMAVGLDAMKRATVVGTPMAGLAGSVDRLTLNATGISVQFPTEQLFHVDGTPRHHWRPPVEVVPVTGDDPVLRRGRALLESAR